MFNSCCHHKRIFIAAFIETISFLFQWEALHRAHGSPLTPPSCPRRVWTWNLLVEIQILSPGCPLRHLLKPKLLTRYSRSISYECTSVERHLFSSRMSLLPFVSELKTLFLFFCSLLFLKLLVGQSQYFMANRQMR